MNTDEKDKKIRLLYMQIICLTCSNIFLGLLVLYMYSVIQQHEIIINNTLPMSTSMLVSNITITPVTP